MTFRKIQSLAVKLSSRIQIKIAFKIADFEKVYSKLEKKICSKCKSWSNLESFWENGDITFTFKVFLVWNLQTKSQKNNCFRNWFAVLRIFELKNNASLNLLLFLYCLHFQQPVMLKINLSTIGESSVLLLTFLVSRSHQKI